MLTFNLPQAEPPGMLDSSVGSDTQEQHIHEASACVQLDCFNLLLLFHAESCKFIGIS